LQLPKPKSKTTNKRIDLHYAESAFATQVNTLAVKANDELRLRRGFQEVSGKLRRRRHDVNRNARFIVLHAALLT